MQPPGGVVASKETGEQFGHRTGPQRRSHGDVLRLVAVLQAPARPGVEEPLAFSDTAGRVGGDLGRQRERLVEQCSRWDDPVEQADAFGGGGVDPPGGEEQLLGPG